MVITKRLLLLATVLIAFFGFVATPQTRERARIESDLAKWRSEIDGVDRKIVELLNRRAEYVLKLSPLKQQLGSEVRDPGREAIVLGKLKKASAGPLPDESLEDIYQAIMGAMRDLQSRE